MKNFIPLILAVIVGCLAVFVVHRKLANEQRPKERMVEVVVTTRKIESGSTVKEGDLRVKAVPASARPANVVPGEKLNHVVGLVSCRAIPSGDYIFFDDVPAAPDVIAGHGEWAVIVRFEKSSITQLVKPGDDIAIIATFPIKETQRAMGGDGAIKVSETSREVTTVLLPRVRVISVGSAPILTAASGLRRIEQTEMLMSLPPEQAQVLIAAKSMARLDMALRRPNDDSALSRSDLKVVDHTTFENLIKGMKSVEMPDLPGKAAGVEAAAP